MKTIPMNGDHWEDVKRIYQEGIDTGQATFEESPPSSWQEWSQKFLNNLSLVCLQGDIVVGWAAVSRTSSREVYSGVGEVSLYVDPEYQGRGIGKRLMKTIILRSEDEGFWTLQAGIFPENGISLDLHQSFGFRVVGVRRNIGKMSHGPLSGRWRDVLLLERRSKTIGLKN